MVAVGLIAAASCHHEDNGGRGDGGADAGVPIGGLYITPSAATLQITRGGPPASQVFQVFLHGDNGDQDVTSASSFTLSDMTLGSMSGATFTTSGTHGGSAILTASYNGEMANASIVVQVSGTFDAPDCAGCSFPPDNVPACAASAPAISIAYPPNGVLLPPNMEVISVQWTPFGSAFTEFEVDFKNTATDVRVHTKCATQTMDTAQPPKPSGGCELLLDPTMWDFIALTNRGGDPLTVTVRGTTDGSCASSSTNTTNVLFAEQDVNGGIYYWKSTVSANGTGGQIWAKSFGDATPEEQVTSALTGTCNGCHSLSRDGKRMVVNTDDDDSDDEYGDVRSILIDVTTKMTVGTAQTPGFQAFFPDHSLYVGTNGQPAGTSNQFFLYDGNTGMPAMPATVPNIGPAMARPTHVDWSPDGKSLLFTLPTKVGTWNSHKDDDHVFGGSIYTVPYMGMGMFGTPTAIITSAGENNYYPSLSPDSNFIVFDRVPLTGTVATIDACTGTGMQVTCPNDSFSNPAARVFVLPTAAGAAPVDCAAANGSSAMAPVAVSNSWPRWSPFIQKYKGASLLWVTFSSTRDYGLRVRNHETGMFQCYPADSFEQPGTPHGGVFSALCQQPQIWMAAINLTTAGEFGGGTDPSYPAFWLPFQDITTHNHTAQWTETVATQPPPDMGTCIATGGNCAANPNGCCMGFCGADGTCTVIK
jgi:hypothetical protein